MKRSNIVALVLFFVAVGGILALNPRNTIKAQSYFLGMVAPFFRTGSSLHKEIVDYRQKLKTLLELEQENKTLMIENRELTAKNEFNNGLAAENEQLRNALGYEQRSPFNLIPARIIARDAGSWWSTVKIDRGRDVGVDSDMPVLTEDGLVGKTTTVANNVCTVVLIADENCKVSAVVEGTREQGIVMGERIYSPGIPEISLNFLSKNANLKPGMKVYTSGVGGVYPSGLPIGIIKDFKVRELDSRATIIPSVDLTTLQDVFIVVGKK
ncbi:MAG TPA: rod shape-determining protein MreC [Chthoniobacteraceae bacterium]|nr:rod shape-determining protein MreC [Chthoniobacteraceae bacterium]